MEYKYLLVKKEENIAVVILNRPEVLNALSGEVFHELYSVMGDIEQDKSIKVAIVTGAGDKAFAAGADITWMVNKSSMEMRSACQITKLFHDRIENMKIPVIAAINGFALGGGCELALACDIRVMSQKARIGLPEITLGIIPGGGGTQRLARLVGKGKAMELVLTGKFLDAAEALSIGLVNVVAEPDKVMDEAMKLAKKIASLSSVAVNLAKDAVKKGMNADLETGLNYEIECFSLCFSSEDQKEGMTAFLEKRRPAFKNR
ncbi:MAG: enoyl-CoA hydratase-related protein [Syntrophales bacterium]